MTSCLQYQSYDTKLKWSNADKICRNVNELDIPWLSKYNVLHSSLSQITLLGKLSRVPFCYWNNITVQILIVLRLQQRSFDESFLKRFILSCISIYFQHLPVGLFLQKLHWCITLEFEWFTRVRKRSYEIVISECFQ